jgi:predicted nucleotidyltransferase
LGLDEAAVEITKDFKEVVFVGAYAAIHYGVSRGTHDIDLALASPVTDDEFRKLGYGVFDEGGKKVIRTQHGLKMDVHTKDVSGIPVPQIFATAVTVRAAGSPVRIMCLEALLLAKMRAGRPQDSDDLQQLCRSRGKSIRWDVVGSMAKSLEMTELKGYVRALS